MSKTEKQTYPQILQESMNFLIISLPFQTLLARKVNRLYTFCWINLQENKGS